MNDARKPVVPADDTRGDSAAAGETPMPTAVDDRPAVAEARRAERADAAGPPARPQVPTRNPARPIAAAVLLAFVLLIGWQIASDRLAPYSSRGAVSGYIAQLTPQVAGRVIEVLVQDGDVVESGQPLARLDPRPFDVAVAQAETGLARALQSARASVTGVISAQAGVTRARSQLTNVQATTSRTLELVARGFFSKAQGDDARAAQRTAEAALAQAEADLNRAVISAGGTRAANPEVRSAQLQLERAQLDREFATITAPTRGVVTNVRLAIGQYLAPGTPALTFIDARGAWITADLRENQLVNVGPGDEVDILFDAVPGTVFRGRVHSIAWGVDIGRGSAGGLLANLPEGQWFDPARRLPVHIELDGGLDAWPRTARIGGKAGVVVYADGRSNPVAWLAAGLLRLRSWLSYLY